MSLLYLAFTFFYIGLFTIGGGMVAITLMQQTIVDTGIISQDLFFNMVAISESTPGPLGINMATYIGYNQYGVIGGMVCTFAEALPSVIIIMIIAKMLKKFNKSPYVKGSLAFLRPITTGLVLVPLVQIICMTLIKLPDSIAVLTTFAGWKDLFEWINIAAYAVFTFILFKFKLHPIVVILIGAVFGIVTGYYLG
ncbi:MAG: chromate transporter [Treponema sp.]|nr:chromate transporter [Treponema sp.]